MSYLERTRSGALSTLAAALVLTVASAAFSWPYARLPDAVLTRQNDVYGVYWLLDYARDLLPDLYTQATGGFSGESFSRMDSYVLLVLGWAFGPALAGGRLTFERFRAYVRNPLARMPAYPESELTDQEIADMVAYFATIPAGANPLAWRTPLPEGAPRGQQLAISIVGCAQCHGATFETPRHGAAEVTVVLEQERGAQ